MPIYEFYCSDCHTIFNFFSRTVNPTKRPACPKCQRLKLQRRISRFAISKGASSKGTSDEADQEDLPPGFDEAKMERAMEQLAREADGLDEDDPRQAAHMMRKLYESTGMRVSDRMEEAFRRMEAGEDPDKIDEEMGDVFDEEEPLFGEMASKVRGFPKRLRPPQVDETLYDL